ncbi:MAG TPA: glycosyltransferase, partial [Chthoniobacterales bacterium]
KLPSLRGFQPRFYSAGPARFHLPLLYDLVAELKPKRIVVVGFGDGDAFLTLCQAVDEQKLDCECVAVRHERAGESEEEDAVWREGRDYGEEFYGERARFFADRASALAAIADGTVDLLLHDDSDSGTEIRANLAAWEMKLGNNAVVLLHGHGLDRQDSPGQAWDEWVAGQAHAVFPGGIGLGIALRGKRAAGPLLKEIVEGDSQGAKLATIYALAAARIDADARALHAEKNSAALEIRQVWLDSLLADRHKTQEVMDHQMRTVANLEQRYQLLTDMYAEQLKQFEILRADRAKAQLVMDSQAEQLRQWVAESEKLKSQLQQLKAQVKEQKQILNAAKKACRKSGRCFQLPGGPKQRRPFGQRIVRELRRLPRNLGIVREPKPEPDPRSATVPATRGPADRYQTWIEEHEPDAAALEDQRRLAKEFATPIKISLLVPVYNTPANYLEEMFASVAAQTYENWELCVVDGGSDRAETIEILKGWKSRDQRIRVQRLTENLGISENSNRALQMATGDFIACVDHDDLLAPFALFELARAVSEFPEADIFYSDEDRLSAEG